MLEKNLHRLLRRQIKNANFEKEDLKKFKEFFNVVNDAYNSFDDDVKHIEIILEQSSHEQFKLNQALRSTVIDVRNDLETIVNTIEGVIFKTDMEGNYKYLNKAWEDLTGIPVQKALNHKYRDFLFGKNEAEKKRIRRFLKEGKDDYSTLFKYIRPNGEKVWIQLKLELIQDSEGKNIGTIGTMIDVTQLKETEIQLNQANKTKDAFLSTMSHEIRTPLNAVIGMSDILLMEKFLPEQLENLQVLKYSSEHLLALINDLLDLNKFKSEEIKLVEEDFNITELVQNIQLHFKQTAQKKELVFETIVDSELPSILRGDSLKLSQVLKNLLSNAFKFTHEGGVAFYIKLIENNQDNCVVRFTVEDTGIGVSYNKQKDIFKSFVQANNDTSKLYGGSGLGLYISKELLKIQGSELHLQSQIGNGSTFWFDVPFKHSGEKTISKKNLMANTDAIDLKVLVAEDNNLNVLLLKKLLTKWSVDFTITNDGQELLDVYENNDFDLILMDLQMPVLDGYQTTREIRNLTDESKASIPIIALTAFTQSEVNEKIERFKMNGYLSKPFDVNQLHSLLSFYSKENQEVV
ncbi:PAS domain-containing hybrid sensor histidine kinase/response regulator [Winogradskyella vincentii]|uniref:histidine kinase n=1 Tax=Winogradskyella vincentii TaxID=2877122 RepID=A0ABS7XX44_9FLAO|nr:PAS domain-containing hybrid sensor histidine kinase/response regulator [Winogradskyella vincentii]MCA0151604.1 response regulator [Winogradskyella vincentii]